MDAEEIVHMHPTGDDSFTYSCHEIIYSRQDNSLLEGQTCTNYDNAKEKYKLE